MKLLVSSYYKSSNINGFSFAEHRLLKKVKGEDNYDIFAYCLMSNHIHLLLRQGKDNLDRLMKRITVSYVYYFNKKYQRVGHLFQDRYMSEAVEDDAYVLAAARYIHNNPVKAGITASAEDYQWSSYIHYINETGESDGLVETNTLLGMMSSSRERAIELFIEFNGEQEEDLFKGYEKSHGSSKVKVELSGSLRDTIIHILNKYNISIESFKSLKDKQTRNQAIREIKETTGASVREVSEILGLSKDMIFRA